MQCSLVDLNWPICQTGWVRLRLRHKLHCVTPGIAVAQPDIVVLPMFTVTDGTEPSPASKRKAGGLAKTEKKKKKIVSKANTTN